MFGIGIGLYLLPEQKQTLRQTLIRKCPHCGVENDIGCSQKSIQLESIFSMNKIIWLCWNCKNPLYKNRKGPKTYIAICANKNAK